jgi:predicted ferric reductase
MKAKLMLAWFGIFLISVLPVMLLFALGPNDYSSVTHTLGQMCGLIGMTMFALTFVLSTRAKWIEYLFDGLDKVYPVHATLGAVSLVLLLMHPIFLVMKYIPENIRLAAVYLLPGGLLSVDFGIFALLGMILLLIITVYSGIKYNHWKVSHKFLGLFFALAILHVFLIRATVARDYIFKGYYVYAAAVSIIGLSSLIYSLVRTRLLGRKYTVKKITALSEGSCYEIMLEPVGKGIRFKSGQFVFVKFKNKKTGIESHPFSIASPSGNKEIRIIAKSLGDFTSLLGSLNKGDSAVVEGPYGRFHVNGFSGRTDDGADEEASDKADEVWVAGGIGITPFIGLAEDFANSKAERQVHLFYSVKERKEVCWPAGAGECCKA